MPKKVWLPNAGHYAYFHHRDRLRPKSRKPATAAWPSYALPIGYVNVNDALIPMDGNDTLGICGPAMGAHVDNVLTFRATGTASVVSSISAFEDQYESVSGGDNGTDEDEMVGPIWGPPNGIAGITPAGAVLDDHLDLQDLTAPNVQGSIGTMGFACMAFSVPDAWIKSFDPTGGAVWDGPATPDPENGHFVALVGVDAEGRYILLTWGSYVYLTQAGLESCDAGLFTGFTARAFNPKTGLCFDGQTYAAKSQVWQSLGGAVPPPSPFGPVPTPGPTPTPVPAGVSGTFISGVGTGHATHKTITVTNGLITGIN